MEEPARRGIMLDRAMIIVKKTIKMVEDIWVIGWPIRTVRWAWEGVGYLWDERKDRQRYGKPIRAWMVWKKLGREMTVAIQEGAEKERNRKDGKRWGWTRGVRWVDRGVRGPEDRREMWLHSGDSVRIEERVGEGVGIDYGAYAEGASYQVGVDYGLERPEIVVVSSALNGEETREENKTYVKEFMESYGQAVHVRSEVRDDEGTYGTRLG